MIYEIFQILLWVTAIMLFISGIDDLYMDLLFWLQRRKYKKMMPDFNEMFDKDEKPVSILLGAWKESAVIGRTLSYAVRNLNYSNYRIFVGVYPNDEDTIRVVQEISKKEPRVIACINPQKGPTTKADNLNSLYAGLLDYEKVYGKFEIILVHDAEDFLHTNSLKLYNYLLGYKGFHAVQIPVIPIKSKLGKLFHRTYCDAFAEVHTKDMIVRQAMGTFIPFSGTGMGFHRKTFNYLEKYNWDLEKAKLNIDRGQDPYDDERRLEVLEDEKQFSEEDFKFQNDEEKKSDIYVNETNYHEDPFQSLNDSNMQWGRRNVPEGIKNFTFLFFSIVLAWVAFLIYTGKAESEELSNIQRASFESINLKGDLYANDNLLNTDELIDNNILPSEISKTKNGYFDKTNNVVYIKDADNRILVQESAWSSEFSAKARYRHVMSSNVFSGKSVRIEIVNISGETFYRVIIGTFNNIEEAVQSITKYKKFN